MAQTRTETPVERSHREACEAVKVRYQETIKGIADKVRFQESLNEGERMWLLGLVESASTQVGSNWFLLTVPSIPAD